MNEGSGGSGIHRVPSPSPLHQPQSSPVLPKRGLDVAAVSLVRITMKFVKPVPECQWNYSIPIQSITGEWSRIWLV